jgi:hypothetical protein
VEILPGKDHILKWSMRAGTLVTSLDLLNGRFEMMPCRPTRAGQRFIVLFASLLGACWLVASPLPAAATWPVDGLPVCTAPGPQQSVRLVADGEGGAFAVWADGRSGNNDIFAQHVDRSGNVVAGWPPNGLPVCTEPSSQTFPLAIADGLGGFIAVWPDARDGVSSSIYAQHVTRDGSLFPGWPADGRPVVQGGLGPGPSDYVRYRLWAIASDGAGGVFVGYQWFSVTCQPDYGCTGIVGQPLVRGMTASGIGGNIRSVGDNGGVDAFDLVPDGAGGVLTAVRTSSTALWAARVDASGSYQWIFQTHLGPDRISNLTAAPDGTGGIFIVGETWTSVDAGDIWALRLMASGDVAPGWPAAGLPVSVARGFQVDPVAVPGEPGQLIVAWRDTRNLGTVNPAVDGDLYAQMLGADGAPLPGWPVDGASVCSAPGRQDTHQVTYDGLGGAWVAWADFRDGSAPTWSVFATRLAPTGGPAPGWPVDGDRVTGTASGGARGALVSSGSNAAIVSWQDWRSSEAYQQDIYAQRISQDAPVATLVDLVSVVAAPGRVDLVGLVAGSPGARATIHRRAESGASIILTELESGPDGRVQYTDRDVVAGARYGYRLAVQVDGREVMSSEVVALLPGQPRLSLSVPYPGDETLAATVELAGGGPGLLEVMDLSGRRLAQLRIEGMGPGMHHLSIPEARGFPAGVYMMRLSEGDRSITRRACVIR